MPTFEVTRGGRVFEVIASSPDEAGSKADAALAAAPATAASSPMTLDQQKAIAIATARMRAISTAPQQDAAPTPPLPDGYQLLPPLPEGYQLEQSIPAAPDAPAAPGPTSWLPGGETLGDATQRVGSGIPFSDEILAGAATPFRAAYNAATGADAGKSLSDRLGGAYDTEVAHERQLQSDASVRSPIAGMIGDVAGGALTMGGGGAAAELPSLAAVTAEREAAAQAAAAAAAPVKSAATRVADFAGRTGKSAGAGAAYGGVQGFSEGEGLNDRLNKGKGGALWGSLAGGVGTPLLEGATKVGENFIAPGIRAFTNPAGQAARKAGASIEGDARLAAMSGSEVPQRGLNNAEYDAAQAAGLPVTNLDRGGKRTLQTADAAVTRSPEARAILDPMLDQRHGEQFDQTSSLIDSMMPGGGSTAAREAIIKKGRLINDANYKMANLHPNAQGMWDKNFEQMMQSDQMQKAAKDAISTGTNDAAANGFTPIRAPFKTDPATGRLVMKSADEIAAVKAAGGKDFAPNLAFWNETKKGLDDIINKGSDPITKHVDNNARQAIQMKSTLLNHLDKLVPTYKTARAGAGRYLGEANASALGEKLFSTGNKLKPGELAQTVSKWTPAEHEEAATSYLDAYRADLKRRAKAPNTGTFRDLSKNLFGDSSQANLDVARSVIGRPRADRLEALNAVQSLMASKRQGIGKGSPTATRIIADKLLSPFGGAGAAYGANAWETGDLNPFSGATLAGAVAGLGGRVHNSARDRMAVEFSRLMSSGDRNLIPSVIGRIADNPKMMGYLRLLARPLQVLGAQHGASP